MQLNIKSDEAYRLAAELSALTGESLTASVTLALRERLERERRRRDSSERLARIHAIAAEIRGRLGLEAGGADHAALYDAQGLPR